MFVATKVASEIKKIKTRKYRREFALDSVAIRSENYLLKVVLFRLVGDVKSFVPFLFSGSLMLKLGESCYNSLLSKA